MTVAAARLRVVSNREPAAVAVPGAARATLTVELGHSSLTGPRPRNEDFCGAVTPEGAELQSKGLLAIAALYALSAPVWWVWTKLRRKPPVA